MISKKSMFAIAKTLEGVLILGALPNSPAARAGVRYGDILLSVNGIRTRTALEYLEAKAVRTGGMSVVLFRSGQEELIELEYEDGKSAADPVQVLADVIGMRVGPSDLDEEPGPSGRGGKGLD